MRGGARAQVVTAIMVALVTLGSGPARAQDRGNAAREAFERALVLKGEEQWGEAARELQSSLELQTTQVALYDLALCFERFLREFGAHATTERRGQVEDLLDRLRTMPGHARVAVDIAGATILVNGHDPRTEWAMIAPPWSSDPSPPPWAPSFF